MRKRVLRTTALMGLLTVLDKGLAAARHMVLAAFFGAGAAMDALVVGVSVAELLVALLTGSFLVVFIPLYADWRRQEGPAVADRRALNLVALLAVLLAVAAVGLAQGGGTLAGWVGRGFSGDQHRIAASLMPWLGVFLWGSGAGVLVTGLYHVRSRFVAPQMAQMAERVVVLAVLVILVPLAGIRAAAMALAAGALALVVVLAAGALRRRSLPRAPVSPRAPEVRAYLVLFLPLLAAAVVDQAVLFTDRAMASTLDPGGVSALYYASIVWGIPVVLLCANFATVLFPRLAEDVAAADAVALARSLRFGLKTMVLLMLGATALTWVLAGDLVALLFQRGQFDGNAAALTAAVLMALSLCLVFQGTGTVVNMALYALHRTGTVAACGVVRVLLNVGLNILLMRHFGAVGIALSTSITLAVWFIVISVPFRGEMRRLGVPALLDGDFIRLLGKATAAMAAAGLAAQLVATLPLLAGGSTGARILRLGLAGGMGVAVYATLLHMMRLPEAARVIRLVSARLGLGSVA